MGNREIRKLPVRLTRDEYDAKAQELTSKLIAISETEYSLKLVQKNMKEDIKAMKETVGLLTKIVRTRTEDREVECYEVRDEDRMLMQVYRSDTSELVETRAMTQGERQLVMFPGRLTILGDPIAEEKSPVPVEPPPDSAQTATGETAPTEEIPFE